MVMDQTLFSMLKFDKGIVCNVCLSKTLRHIVMMEEFFKTCFIFFNKVVIAQALTITLK